MPAQHAGNFECKIIHTQFGLFMKHSQLEILLFTNTSFASKQLCDREGLDNKGNDAGNINLEEACWNGLLWETLPELYIDAGSQKELVLWKITQGDNFLELDYGALSRHKDYEYSINPYLFLRPVLQS
jgi:hypothetical protein